jgi:hypothetical protein
MADVTNHQTGGAQKMKKTLIALMVTLPLLLFLF